MTNPPEGDEHDRRDRDVSDHVFGSQWWERHYHEKGTGPGVPSPHLVTELTGLPVGAALEAGCGSGADAVWLAQQGWDVTAVDISATVLRQARQFAADRAPEVADRMVWIESDLTTWVPPQRYDLVVSQYVHTDIPFPEFVARLAQLVASDGTLFVAGHDHADSYSAAHAPEDVAVGLEAVTAALSSNVWSVEVAETRTRQVIHDSTRMTMHDLVVKAHRSAAP